VAEKRRKLLDALHACWALGHSNKGIRAHYDDPGEYQPMIDTAVQAVANEVERILNPPSDNVVPPRTQRGDCYRRTTRDPQRNTTIVNH
jgi:hypothetical protein